MPMVEQDQIGGIEGWTDRENCLAWWIRQFQCRIYNPVAYQDERMW